MKNYKLTVAENQLTGEIGVIVCTGRKYHDPWDGTTAAHDILEHPATPHHDPYIDEFMALGAMAASRIATNHRSFSRPRADSLADLSSDIARLVLERPQQLCPISSRNRVRDSRIVSDFIDCVKAGIEEARYELKHEPEFEIHEINEEELSSIVGWMCKGYSLYRARFRRSPGNAIYLFDQIQEEVDRWLSDNDLEGAEATLCVDFANGYCHIAEHFSK